MAEITTTERLPFPLAKPNADTYVTKTSEIGHKGDSLADALAPLDNVEKQSTQSDEQALVFETDGGTQVGKIDSSGADFVNLKRGGQQVARMSDLPTKDTSIGDSPSTTNVPTTKAVKDYVDAHSGGDYPIETEATQSDDEEQVWGDNTDTQEFVKIGEYGIKAKAYFDMQGNPINGIDTAGMIGNLANINFIPIFGQSLSVGAAAFPAISKVQKYPAGIMFNGGVRCAKKAESFFTSFIPLVEQDNITPSPSGDSTGSGETVASGCLEKLVELLCNDYGINPFSSFYENHKFLFGSFGSGSKTISELVEVPETGIGYYQGMVNAMNAAKRLCNANGWTLNIPAWIWIQGETDQKSTNNTSKADYKAALLQLAEQIDTDAKTITGQTNEVKCICYQIGSQNIVTPAPTPAYNSTAMDVPMAQMELVRDNDMFVASSPVYVLDHSTQEPIHLSAIGEKMLGLYCGNALKKVLDGSLASKGVTPSTVNVDGNTITIVCNVQSPPLRINTEWVKEVSHFGFSVLTSNNTDIITNVSVFDDTITITCSQSPLGCKLYYGYNGIKTKDGRIEGSRGNICDSADQHLYGEIDKKDYNLANYLYSFEYMLNE